MVFIDPTGRVADVTQLAEVRQKRSVTLRVSSHNMQSSVMSCSKSASRQGNLSKKPFLMHSMKVKAIYIAALCCHNHANCI